MTAALILTTFRFVNSIGSFTFERADAVIWKPSTKLAVAGNVEYNALIQFASACKFITPMSSLEYNNYYCITRPLEILTK